MEGLDYCPLSEKVEDDPKAAKAAVALFNVQTVEPKCHATKLRGLPAECPSLSRN
jgi:hypothetical protein